MKIPDTKSKSRGIAGILAAIIMFAMIFTAGISLFLYQLTIGHQNDKASQYNQNLFSAKSAQQLTIVSHPLQGRLSAGTVLSALVSNVGGNSTTFVGLFVKDQTGSLVCASPSGSWGSTPSCLTSIVGSSGSITVLPSTFSLNQGSSLNITTGFASNSASLTSCATSQTCSVGLITRMGNVFLGSYPLASQAAPSVTTTLSSIVIAPGTSVYDTAILAGVSNTAGGNVKYYYFTNGICTSGRTLEDTKTVTNGVVPNSVTHSFALVGSYSWQAVYSGDLLNSAATSPCEPLAVTASGVCDPTIQICPSSVAEGLGSISFNFDSFKWYSYSPSCSPGGTIDNGLSPNTSPSTSCHLSPTKVNGAPLAYSISSATWSAAGCSAGAFCIFSANITNADPHQRTIVLSSSTQLWFSNFNLKPGGGTAQSWAYGLISMNGNGTIPTSPLTTATAAPTVTIAWNHMTTIFFGINRGGNPDQSSAYNASPIFLLFSGSLICSAGNPNCSPLGTFSWGEDFPLATTLWTS